MRKPVEYGEVRSSEVLAAVGRRLSKQGCARVKLAQARAVHAVYSGAEAAYDPGEAVYAAANQVLAALTQKRLTTY